MRDHLRLDGIPTRCDMTLMSAAELAIMEAMRVVEASGGSPALTDAVELLSKARGRVADHVEGRP
jgi:3-deoxy-D-manno-octulosonate 8-phosphate phosphatase KdsC-like HAD superfamily phosphatase